MRLDRFTERSQEALQAAQTAAAGLQHPTVEPEHLLLALLQRDEGLVPAFLYTGGGTVEVESRRRRGRPPAVGIGSGAAAGLSPHPLGFR